MNLKISKEANNNYLAKIVKLKNIQKHPNADRLQVVKIDFQNVITDMTAKEGDIYVYFPLECEINSDFLSFINAYRKKELNIDREKSGFFEENNRVRAAKLRGEKSMGFIIPVYKLEQWSGESIVENNINTEFDTVGDIVLLKKYVARGKKSNETDGFKKKQPVRLNRLVEGQVHLHVDTNNLRRNVDKLDLLDKISITYKMHGTSIHMSNVLVYKKLSWKDRFFKFLGANIQDKEYDVVYGSRKTVKNKYLEDPKGQNHFYGVDVWGNITEKFKDVIPKGVCIYGEIVGYTGDGGLIQKGYPYDCQEGESELYVYRMTFTNPDGNVFEFSTEQIMEFCIRNGLKHVPVIFRGTVHEYLKKERLSYDGIGDNWREKLISSLESKYNEKDCYICNNGSPEEGIVLRKENMYKFEAYKLKSFRFLDYETKQLDTGEIDLETGN